MLKNTFCHIHGITENTEKILWQNNILCWDDFLEKKESINLPSSKLSKIHEAIISHNDLYLKNDFSFFNTKTNQHWRLWRELRKDACYLDIETTGLDKVRNHITTIGVFDGKSSHVFVQGKDLDKFENYIKDKKLLVTFNGACFDLPFIEKQMNINLNDKFHIDLRFAMKKLGYSGGLKNIEKQLDVSRDDELADVDGFEAVRLWYRYKKGDLDALKLLMKYNEADVINLEPLMEFTFNKLREKEFLVHIE